MKDVKNAATGAKAFVLNSCHAGRATVRRYWATVTKAGSIFATNALLPRLRSVWIFLSSWLNSFADASVSPLHRSEVFLTSDSRAANSAVVRLMIPASFSDWCHRKSPRLRWPCLPHSGFVESVRQPAAKPLPVP